MRLAELLDKMADVVLPESEKLGAHGIFLSAKGLTSKSERTYDLLEGNRMFRHLCAIRTACSRWRAPPTHN